MKISIETINTFLAVATNVAQSINESNSVKDGLRVAVGNLAVAETIASNIDNIVVDFRIHRDRGIAHHDLLNIKRRLSSGENTAFLHLQGRLTNAAKACRVKL